MNKFLVLSSVLLVAAAALLTHADEQQGGAAQTEVKHKTLNSINKAADKVGPVVHTVTERLENKIDRLEKRQQENPNIIYSALRGAGSLVKNVTVEIGKFVGTVGRGAWDLGKHTTAKTGETVAKSARRIAHCPTCKQPIDGTARATEDAAAAESESSSNEQQQEPAPAQEDAQAPAELTNKEATTVAPAASA